MLIKKYELKTQHDFKLVTPNFVYLTNQKLTNVVKRLTFITSLVAITTNVNTVTLLLKSSFSGDWENHSFGFWLENVQPVINLIQLNNNVDSV